MSAFARCIREATEKTPNVSKIGVLINSSKFDFPLEVPFRPLWINSPGALLNQFLRVGQSHEDSNVYGAPVQIVITALSNHAGGKNTKSPDFTRNVNQKNLIKVSHF